MQPWALTSAVILLYAVALYAILGRPRPADDGFAARAVAAMCLGPSAAAWMLGLCWRVVPGLPDFATLSILLLIPATVVLTVAVRRLRSSAPRVPTSTLNLQPLQALLLALLLACIVYLVLRIPPYSNDPLEYAAVARLLHEKRSLDIYPVLDTTLSGGLYAPWTHPPGFPLLMALVMVGGEVDAGTSLKVIAALHVVLGVTGLALLLPQRMRWIGVLSLTATPAYLLGAINGYVEVVRLTALIGVLGACIALRQAPGAASAIRLGVLFGLGGFVHSLGILSTAFFLPVLLLLRPGVPMARLAWGAGIVAAQLLLLAPDLWTNLTHFGVLLGDRPAIWQIPEIGRAEYFREFRSLSGPVDIAVWGLLQGFSQVSNFGVAYWLPAVLLLWTLLSSQTRGFSAEGWRTGVVDAVMAWPPIVKLSAGIVVTFYVMALSLTLTGSIEAIKNPRYVLTLQPFVAIITAWFVLGAPRTDWIRPLLMFALVGFSLIPVGYMAERYPGLLTGTQSRHDAYFTYVHPEADAVLAVDRLAPASGCPLLFKQADYAVYGQRCYRSYLDHCFADAYTARSAKEAADRLRAQGISTIMTPDYALPEIYNTALGTLLADPGAARLRWAGGGYSVYALLAPSIEPKAVVKGGGILVDAGTESAAQVNWADLAINRPPGAEQSHVGVLCVEASGRGRFEVRTIDPQSQRDIGPMLRALRGEGRFVLAAAISKPRRICVQQLASHTRGSLRVQTTGSVRVERIDFAWTLLPATVNKEN